MKAEQILFAARGQIAGALDRLSALTTRVVSLAAVADDVASGVTPLDGIDANSARALTMALEVEAEQLRILGEQMRTGYRQLSELSSRLPRHQVAAADAWDGETFTVEFRT